MERTPPVRPTDDARDNSLDGNAVAGMLDGVYAFDTTLAALRCASCGRIDLVARTRVYLSAMGAVVRCAKCAAELLVVVERPDSGTLLSARGAAWVQAPNHAS